MFFLIITALLIVPVAVAEHRRGIQPYQRLGRHVGTDCRNG